jgi:two-component system OmpR family response regulator/two-component system response regulator RstA
MTDAPTSARLLLVEDDPRLAALVREFLMQHDFDVTIEPRGDRAVAVILETRPALVILDLMLPGLNGLDVCRAVRPRYAGPILMLTARDDDLDQILGLEIGADDYLVKPAEPRVLLARVRALLRRHAAIAAEPDTDAAAAQPLAFGRLRIDRRARRVTLGDAPVPLSTGEFDLLWLLAARAGEPLTRKAILAELRNLTYDGTDRSIDIGISRLRRKLGDDTDPPARIKTLRGKGYQFVPDAWD